jgi:hypothetical protein
MGHGAFKVVQESRELTRVLFVPGSGLDLDAARARTLRDFRDSPGADVQAAVVRIAASAPEASAKVRAIAGNVVFE